MRCLLLLSLAALALRGQVPADLDIFLLIGQSNMAGRGAIEEEDRRPIPGVYMLDRNLSWVPAADPLHYDKPDIAGVGIGRSFARRLQAARPGAQIGLVPAAFGGTSLSEWQPGGPLYAEAVRRMKAALAHGRLRGILWHQGEADSSDERLAQAYPERWLRLIQHLRADLDAPGVPVVAGALGDFLIARRGRRNPDARLVNEQLARLPLLAPNVAFASAAGLTHKGDEVHFDSPSLREFGRRYALAFLALDPAWDTP
jgi:hypothetical protein